MYVKNSTLKRDWTELNWVRDSTEIELNWIEYEIELNWIASRSEKKTQKMKEIPTVSFKIPLYSRRKKEGFKKGIPGLHLRLWYLLYSVHLHPTVVHHQAVAILGLKGEGVPPKRKENDKKTFPPSGRLALQFTVPSLLGRAARHELEEVQ